MITTRCVVGMGRGAVSGKGTLSWFWLQPTTTDRCALTRLQMLREGEPGGRGMGGRCWMRRRPGTARVPRDTPVRRARLARCRFGFLRSLVGSRSCGRRCLRIKVRITRRRGNLTC